MADGENMARLGLLHCSDLHIGPEPVVDKFSMLPVIKYANGHAWLLAKGLSDVMDDVAVQCGLDEEEPLHIVVSGDLTATGHAKEFIVAHTFLRSFMREVRSPGTLGAGLGVRDPIDDFGLPMPTIVADPLTDNDADPPTHKNPRLATVAGNHDQWRGKNFSKNVGYTPTLRTTHFHKTPWRRVWRAGDLELELYGLDSNAGLPQTRGSWRQRGSLDLSAGGEVEALNRYLAHSPMSTLPDGINYRVRALMIHHSLVSKGGLQQASVTRVLELAEKHSFAAILTGHTHDFRAFDHDTLPSRAHKLWELRSASALQGPASRQKPAPGFLAHRLFVDGGKVRWLAWRFVWDSLTKSFGLLQADMTTPFAAFIAP